MKTFLGFGIVRISGRSMAPTLNDGEYAVLRRYGRSREPRAGDIVVYREAASSPRVKRLKARLPDGRYSLQGDGALSAPSADLGALAPDDMIGRVIRVVGRKRALEQPSAGFSSYTSG